MVFFSVYFYLTDAAIWGRSVVFFSTESRLGSLGTGAHPCLVDIQIRGDLIVVAGVGGVTRNIILGNHIHL